MSGRAALRGAGRWLWRIGLLLLLLALTLALGFTLFAVTTLPALQPWHRELLREEFDAREHAGLDFAGYQQLEQRLFDELRAKTAAWADGGLDATSCRHDPLGDRSAQRCRDTVAEAFTHSRFDPKGAMQRLADGAPFNRSFRLAHAAPSGHALLVHGLTDSPYSMCAMAESLHRLGIEVTVLRLPGHGTLPSMMTEMRVEDWTAALRLAARDVASRVAPGKLFYIGGYSSGGTLALQYALDSLQDSALRRPDRVLLVSPAIELTPVAALAEVIDIAALVPVPVLEKVRWQAVEAEFDPYKYNSFAVNASRQINRATRSLRRSLIEAEAGGRLGQMPPVVAWQSVVDSTVGSAGVAERLFSRLRGGEHRLVLFDLNRVSALSGVARPAARLLIDRLQRTPRGYTLDIIGNGRTQTARIEIQRLSPDGAEQQRETELDWPANLVSLGHVALPFPSDDPIYGFMPGSGRHGIPSLGSWLLRGESGAITLSLGSLTRLRSNPFWALIDADVASLVAADAAKR